MNVHWRPWRFGVRTTLLLVLLVAIPLGLARDKLRKIRRQSELVARIERMSGEWTEECIDDSLSIVDWMLIWSGCMRVADPSIATPSYDHDDHFQYYQISNSRPVRCYVRSVDFSWSFGVTDDDLGFLPQIDGLEVVRFGRHPGITDGVLEALARVPTLREIDAHYTQISQLGVERLCETRPDIRVFYIPHLNLTELPLPSSGARFRPADKPQHAPRPK